jgi:predicted chitinase
MAVRNVNGSTSTEDGWPLVDQAGCNWVTVPGTSVSLEIQQGQPTTILAAWAADWNAYVEPLRDADSASWTEGNSVLGGYGQNNGSNHLGGTAIDLNWNSHRFEVSYDGFDDQQIATIREMLDFYEGTVFWAQDWDSPKDPMHSQLGYNTYQNPHTADFIKRKIRPDRFSTFRRSAPAPTPAPTPAPAPAPDPRTAAITALYDAVPVIDMDRSAQLVDAVMAGLALAQCNTVERIAMWLAQIGEESGGFVYTEEIAKNGRYAPYIGRTWIQITWQSNYAAFAAWCVQRGLLTDPDYFVNNPTALADLKWAGIGAAWYWTVARPTINSLCDQGDVVGVTQLINGGQNGIDDRRARYQQAIALGDELLALIAAAPAPTPAPTPEGPLMALTDDEQQELLTKTREIWDQLRGPGGNGWPQLSGLTPVDAIAKLLAAAKTAVKKAAPKKTTP